MKPINLNKADNYNQFLNTKAWLDFSNRKKEMANYKCQICGNAENLNVHHIYYNPLTKFDDEGTVVLCQNCHSTIHNTLDRMRKKALEYPVISNKGLNNVIAETVFEIYKNSICNSTSKVEVLNHRIYVEIAEIIKNTIKNQFKAPYGFEGIQMDIFDELHGYGENHSKDLIIEYQLDIIKRAREKRSPQAIRTYLRISPEQYRNRLERLKEYEQSTA